VFYESRWIRADSPGVLLTAVSLGDVVARGQLLGHVIDPLRDREVEVRAPAAGHVLGMSQNRQVLPGFALFHIGDQTSEAEAVHDAEVAPEDDDIEEDPESQERD
jgi:predicted deacylase